MEIVIYTQRVEVIESYQERRDCADQRIADFIYACGFLPIPVPNRKEIAGEIIQQLHPTGIVLTGGNSPCIYGGNAQERDEMDHELISLAIHKRIPVYGLCRGMQSILSYFGNELENVEGHVAVRHLVKGMQGDCEVNSYHNLACKNLIDGCGLIVTAQSEDCVIEAVRHTSFPIVGTMWHPERESCFVSKDIELVKNCFTM